MHLHVWVCHLISLQSAMFVSSHLVYTFSRVFVPTWNKFMEFSHSEIPQCKNDKDLLSLGLQHMNFLKNITADLDSSWSSKFERAIRRSQVNEPFNEKSSFNDRSIPVYLSVYVSMYLCIYLSICLRLSVCLSVCPSVRPSVRPPTLTLDSEDDYRTGCRNVSYCQQQQSYSGLRSPVRSNSTYF